MSIFPNSKINELKTKHDVDGLIEFLDSNNLYVEDAIKALGELKDKRAVGPLVKLAPTIKERYFYTTLIRVLGDIGGDEALDFLLKTWPSRKENEIASFLYALQKFSGQRVVDALPDEITCTWLQQNIVEILETLDSNWSESESARIAVPRIITELLQNRDRRKQLACTLALDMLSPDWRKSKNVIDAISMWTPRLQSETTCRDAAYLLDLIYPEWRRDNAKGLSFEQRSSSLKDSTNLLNQSLHFCPASRIIFLAMDTINITITAEDSECITCDDSRPIDDMQVLETMKWTKEELAYKVYFVLEEFRNLALTDQMKQIKEYCENLLAGSDTETEDLLPRFSDFYTTDVMEATDALFKKAILSVPKISYITLYETSEQLKRSWNTTELVEGSEEEVKRYSNPK